MTPPRSAGPVRTVVTALSALVVAAAVLAGVAGGSDRTATPAVAPDLALTADPVFEAGNIITDDLFFDGDAMSAAQVQSFLDTKGAACTVTSGTSPCLRVYRQTTPSKAATPYCAAYRGVTGETSASIIAKVGLACGISQRVLLVLLQKEQGLVTTTKPDAEKYRKATGYACPDTAACDSRYFGFFNQVYSAASRYKEYAARPGDFGYRAYRYNTIKYDVESSCGSSSVYIENQATAGLYVYTPYQPNAAALRAGYGSAEPCGAYGNRNFWLYFSNWFGSTRSPGGSAIADRGREAAAIVGTPTTMVRCELVRAGCYQNFTKASIYWSKATGARIILGAIRSRWAALGWENSVLGYPVTDERRTPDGVGRFTHFERGSIYWTPDTGAREVLGAIRTKWAGQGYELGVLGYPTSGERCGLVDAGCFQQFQGGAIYWSRASGARTVLPGPVRERWRDQGWETGALGYPVSDTRCGLRDGGCGQQFQGGAVYSSPGTGTGIVSGDSLGKWGAVNREAGPLGYPIGDTSCGLADGGCSTDFENGAIYSSASTGAHLLLDGAVRDAWGTQGGQDGPLGYPTADTVCGLTGGGCRSEFQGGGIAWTSATGAQTVPTALHVPWLRQGAQSGALGYPTAGQTCGLRDNGCYQQFQGGRVYTSASGGAHAVRADVLTRWSAENAQDGGLGYPVRALNCGLDRGGCVQKFQGGLVYVTPVSGVRAVWGAIRAAYERARWETGVLQYPTSDEQCGLARGGCLQRFERGTIYWSAATGAHHVIGGISGAYTRTGAQAGALGYPTMDERCGLVRGGCYQHFQGGSIYYSPTTGSRPVTGAIRTYWAERGWERSVFGYPVADAVTGRTERSQQFEGGTLVENLATHKVTVRR